MGLFGKEDKLEVTEEFVYAVFDGKANLHLEPFRATTDGVAMRGFMDAVRNPQSVIAKHPEDYSLWKLAKFDRVKGFYTNLDRPINLASATSFVLDGKS